MSELLTCPFCGEPAESDTRRGFIAYNYKPGNAVAVYCTRCNAEMALCHNDFPQDSPETLLALLTDEWNKRTPTPDATGKVLLTKEEWEEAQRDKARLDWLMPKISGAEWGYIGVQYSAGCNREAIDAAMQP